MLPYYKFSTDLLGERIFLLGCARRQERKRRSSAAERGASRKVTAQLER